MFVGQGSMLVVIKNLQQQCDVHGTKILNLFTQDTRLLKTVFVPPLSICFLASVANIDMLLLYR